MMDATLLIELRTEELPPKSLLALSASFGEMLADELKKRQFLAAESVPTLFATPRRLAVSLPAVLAVQPDQPRVRKGPTLSAGMQHGKPTPALIGFARSCQADISELAIVDDGKQLIYTWQSIKAGETLSAVLPGIVAHVLKKLPVSKMMRWGDSEHYFVRPVHGLVMLHGQQLIAGDVFGVPSRDTTCGHRFLSSGPVVLLDADSYARTLFEQGKVIASFTARQALIHYRLTEAAERLSATTAADDALLAEVTALVEWPVILEGGFDDEFLRVPQQALILTMQQNQKYFPLLDAQGRLMNRFLLVANLQSSDPSEIIRGNERVLRARLTDAKFFFEQDQKFSLESRLTCLANVVYHNKLGSQLARTDRLVAVAAAIASSLSADAVLAKRAARLAKADLVSHMVGEFPELQGTMGMYYARLAGEPEVVAAAIEAHYRPRFSGDSLPDEPIAIAVALADKLETLVGIWGVGLRPTSDRDPFALRRAALGILRILLTVPLDLKEWLAFTAQTFDVGKLADGVVDELYTFSLERLKHYLTMSYDVDIVEAVLALSPRRFNHLEAVLAAVSLFKTLPEATALIAANKRVQNMLKQADDSLDEVNAGLLQDTAERALFDVVSAIGPQLSAKLERQDYAGALAQLASLKKPIDAFFDGVMVMSPDRVVRANRLALLGQLAALFNCVADIALLTEARDTLEK